MSGWLAWVGSALVLVSLLLDDRRTFRHPHLVAAIGLLSAGLALGSASMVMVDLVLVGLALSRVVRVRHRLVTH